MRNITALTLSLLLVASSVVIRSFASAQSIGNLNVWTTQLIDRRHAQLESIYVRVVRAAKQNGFDRVVFEFHGPMPSYRIQYLKSSRFYEDNGRHRIKIAGKAFIEIDLNMIAASAEQAAAINRKGFLPKGKISLPSVWQFQDLGVEEGFYDFLIGVSARRAFRVTEKSNPSRLVVDIRH